MKKRVLSLVLVSIMLICTLGGVNVSATEKQSGQCGENVFWEFDGVDTLTISGQGAMYNSLLTEDDVINISLYNNAYKHYNTWDWNISNNVKKIIFKGNVTDIGAAAFGSLKELRDIVLPESIRSIGVSAFATCNNLKKISIPRNCKWIGGNAFYLCSNLEEINMQNGLEKIGPMAFAKCNALKEVVIPDSVNYIGDYAFNGDINLKKITLSKKLSKINKNMFYECDALESVNIPHGVTAIDSQAFFGCNNLKQVNIPNTVKRIERATGYYGVFGFTGIKTLAFPESVEFIGYEAIKDASELEEIYILNPNCVIEGHSYSYVARNSSVTKVYGYEGSTAQAWVNANQGKLGVNYMFVPITSNTVIPENESSDSFADENKPAVKQLATPKVKVTKSELSVGEVPEFSWDAVPNADFYTIWDWTRNRCYDNLSIDDMTYLPSFF